MMDNERRLDYAEVQLLQFCKSLFSFRAWLSFFEPLWIQRFQKTENIKEPAVGAFSFTLQPKLSCTGLCCSPSQPTCSLLTMASPSVAVVCQLTRKLLIRQVTAGLKQSHAWDAHGAASTHKTHLHTNKLSKSGTDWWLTKCVQPSVLLWICKV